jgi:predicted metal-binding membrane protein
VSAAVASAVMALTMLPSAVPMLRVDFATARSRVHTAAVAAGYLAVWCALGAVTMPLAMLMIPRTAVALALVAAAAYQLSPVKRRCLTRCRAPLAQIVFGWRDGAAGGVRMGATNGVWCAGCCAGLLAALLAVGAASTIGMLAFGGVVLLEKVSPWGLRTTRFGAAALAAGGVVWLL